MFAEVYMLTTSPYPQLKSVRFWALILFSIVFHTILYTAFANIIAFIATGHGLSIPINRRMLCCLVIFMFLGYIGRMLHVHDIYRTLRPRQAQEFVDAHYNSWVFLG